MADISLEAVTGKLNRIGYEAFIRNVMVALGNGPATVDALRAVEQRCSDESALIVEHARWALQRLALQTASAQPA